MKTVLLNSKESIDNDNLLFLDRIGLIVYGDDAASVSNPEFRITTSINGIVANAVEGKFSDNSTEKSVAGTTLSCPMYNGRSVVIFLKKYVKEIVGSVNDSFFSFNILSLKGCINLKKLEFAESKYMDFNLADIPDELPLNILKIGNHAEVASNLQGDIKELLRFPSLTQVLLNTNKKIYGDIAQLGSISGLNAMYFPNTGVYGELLDFVRNRIIATGTSSGDVQMFLSGCTHTFDGVAGNGFNGHLTWVVNSQDNTKIDVTWSVGFATATIDNPLS